MEDLYERVAGLDVHKDSVVACVRVLRGGKAQRECRTYDTTTTSLEALREWLVASQCQVVAMEATGVYWMPIFKILGEAEFELIVANAAHVKGVKGRKSDLNDAMWIADLAACGLIKASFVPDEPVHELRTLMRTRKQLVREQTGHVQRIQKTLTEANIRLDSVMSDIMGTNGRRVIEARIAGQRDPKKLVALTDRRLKKATPKQLYDALHGRLTDHHRFLLKLHLQQIDALTATIAEVDREAEARLEQLDQQIAPKPGFRSLIDLLVTIPGVSELSGLSILSEIGPDMSRFATAAQLVAWAGLCPGQNEAPASAAVAACAKARPGSRPCLSNAPGPPSAPRTATTALCSSASALDAVRKRPSAPLPPQSSPRSTT